MIRTNKPPRKGGKFANAFPRAKNPELAERRHNPTEPPLWRKPGPGNPSQYRSWMAEKTVELMAEGKTVPQVCAELDISPRTFKNWVIEIPEFTEAYERGRPKLEAWWLNRYQDSLTTTKDEKVHQALLIFAAKNVAGWCDRMEQTITREHQQRILVKVDWGLVTVEEMRILRHIPEEERKKLNIIMMYDKLTPDRRRRLVEQADRRIEDLKVLIPRKTNPREDTVRETREKLKREREERGAETRGEIVVEPEPAPKAPPPEGKGKPESSPRRRGTFRPPMPRGNITETLA